MNDRCFIQINLNVNQFHQNKATINAILTTLL